MAKGKKQIHVIDSALSQKEFEELRKVRTDPFFFSTFINVLDPVKGKVAFNLYKYQMQVLYYFLTERFNIILKFRQAGITELISLYCLWLAMYHPDKTIVILSIKDRVAKKVLRKIKYMYKNLPNHLKVQVVNGRGSELGTATELEFANGSIISSIPTTEDAGRSEALSLLVIDEAAIIRWANQIWAAAQPTLSTGGAAIVNSTPYGTGNWFHSTWEGACMNRNGFNAIRLRWQMHPHRDIKWYNTMKQALGERRTAQEIDGNFLTSGNNVFDMATIRAIEEELSSYDVKISMNGRLRTYGSPQKDVRYYLGCDIATGRGQDYTAFSLMDPAGEEWVSFKGRIPTNKLRELLLKIGTTWNKAMLAPEANDIGLGVAEGIQDSGYSNLYYAQRRLREKGEFKKREEKIPGWYTTKKNRPLMVDILEQDIREENVIIKDPDFCRETYTFIYDSTNRPVAIGKGSKNNEDEEALSDETFTDDAIFGKCITNIIRKRKHKGAPILPM